MSFDKKIGEPFTLATLSKPVSASNGRPHIAGVCSISGVKKRKRTEIVVGLDGEGISIYALQNPQLVTSYALPPSASFTATPFSVYRKGSSKTPSYRFTYASLKESTRGDRSQLVCFHETILGEKTETVKSAYTPPTNSQILAIEALPVARGRSAKEATHDVLVTFDNGDVISLSSDIETVRWVANLRSIGPNVEEGVQLEYITVATAKAVSRGLLRNREDLVNDLTLSDNASDISELKQILCVIGRPSPDTNVLTLYQIQSRSADLPSSQISPLKRLVSWQLPKPARPSKTAKFTSQYSLHAAAAVLHIVAGGTILSYSFATITPALSSEVIIPGLDVDSFVRLSQDSILTSSQRILRILDVKFGSLQALRSLETSTTLDMTSPTKKRKIAHANNEHQQPGTIQLVAYHADANLVVGLQHNEVIGIQWDVSAARKRGKADSTLLIDALGKGVTHQTPTHFAQSEHKFQERRAKLDRYAAKGKIGRFEQAFAADLEIDLDVIPAQVKRENEVKGGPLTNGIGPKILEEDAMAVDQDLEEGEEDLRKWQLPTSIPDSRRQQYEQYAVYALSKIFQRISTQPTESNQGALEISFFPPNVFQWLLHTGHLSKESIRRAVNGDTSLDLTTASAITDRDVVKALVDFDPDLHILSAILNDDQYLSPDAVVQVIKLLIQSLDDQPKAEETTKLLTNGTTRSEEDMDVDITSEIEAASHEIDHALAILDQGLLIRSSTLRPALIRLHRFSTSVISSTLRSTLSRRDLESLIRLLHTELKNGGWSTTYDFVETDSSPIDTSGDSPDDNAVAIIASLLSCTLDAIGAGAWLASVGSSADAQQSSEDIIRSLYEDTSEALSGFWEARYMRGLLSEFLRFATNVPKSQKPSSKTLERQNKPFVMGKDDGELPMLPLGAKPDMGIERMKAGKGGRKEERSKREMGMLISKRVPKYSFERIVI